MKSEFSTRQIFAGQEPLISRGDGPDQNLSLNTFAGLW